MGILTDDLAEFRARMTRRAFLGRTGAGLGSLALASLLEGSDLESKHSAADEPTRDLTSWPGAVRPLHVAPKAKRVIHLYQAGGPSHLELFDWKPRLAALHGEPMPESFTKGQPIAQLQGQALKCFGPQHPFTRYGASGQEMTTLLPEIGAVADKICIVRSLQTEQINHDPAHTFMNCGTAISGRPSMGAWVTYGLGSEADDLPGFVVMTSKMGRGAQPIAARQWHSGFLPGQFQHIVHSGGSCQHRHPPPARLFQPEKKYHCLRPIQGRGRFYFKNGQG